MRLKLLYTLALLFVSLLFSNNLAAQDYKFGAGISIGEPFGLDLKYFITRRGAVAATFGYGAARNTLMFSATYQQHLQIHDNLNLYGGGGFNIGKYGMTKGYSGKTVFGLDPNVGIEYKIFNAPLAFAFDYKPCLNFGVGSQWQQASIKARYTF